MLCLGLMLSGCVSSKYRRAPRNTPPPVALNLTADSTALAATLNTVITYNGPGSWKRNAFWDEYVFSLRNTGDQSLMVTSAVLQDHAGKVLATGNRPWALEKESKTQERLYKEAGVAFARYVVPGTLIAGAGVAAAASTMSFMAPAGAAAGGAAATASIVALPLYYLAVASINHSNKRDMTFEFNRRNLVLPLTLAPGETRSGSFFFPVATSPRHLSLHWSAGGEAAQTVVPLASLAGLHTHTPGGILSR
jgi:hypothetical protein